MTELTSLGSQSSRLKMLHLRQVQLLRLEEAAELPPEEPPPTAPPPPPPEAPGGLGDSEPPPPPAAESGSKLRAELALRFRAAAADGRRAPPPPPPPPEEVGECRRSGEEDEVRSSRASRDDRDCTACARFRVHITRRKMRERALGGAGVEKGGGIQSGN